MYKLDVGLGYSIIKHAYESLDIGILNDVIGQHRVILSENIVKYYLNKIEPTSIWKPYIEAYINTIANVGARSVYYSIDDSFSDTREEIVSCVMKAPMKILVSDETEFEGIKLKNINLTTSENIKSKDFKYVFNRYVLPVTKVAKQGDSCNPYIKWLENLFKNESSITIVDPYLMGEGNLRSFIVSILPSIPQTAEVEIYCSLEKSKMDKDKSVDYSKAAERSIQFINEKENRKITIHWCRDSAMHDRFIILSNCEIEITGGLRALNKDKEFFKECRFSITKEKQRSLPLTIEEALLTK